VTTITTNPTEIQTAATEAADALRRLLQLAREDYTFAGPLEALDALASPEGPLNALSEQLGELDAYLADFDRADDSEHDGIDDARTWLGTIIDGIDYTITDLGSAAGTIRDLV